MSSVLAISRGPQIPESLAVSTAAGDCIFVDAINAGKEELN
jgi:hypothetical protein